VGDTSATEVVAPGADEWPYQGEALVDHRTVLGEVGDHEPTVEELVELGERGRAVPRVGVESELQLLHDPLGMGEVRVGREDGLDDGEVTGERLRGPFEVGDQPVAQSEQEPRLRHRAQAVGDEPLGRVLTGGGVDVGHRGSLEGAVPALAR
jgi:hypothetical protein